MAPLAVHAHAHAFPLLFIVFLGHNALLLVSVLPIAFGANILRVTILVLVTYHFGDAAGQGLAHGFTGMGLFALALLMLFGLDALLRTIAGFRGF